MSKYTGWADLPTIQSKEIISELIEAKEKCQARLLISETGIGKSHTINLFAAKQPDHTYIMTVGHSWRKRDVIDNLLELLHLPAMTYRTLTAKLLAIADEFKTLKEAGHTPVLIIDEAENMRPASLGLLKELYDAMIRYCSIVLVGTPDILELMNKMRKRNHMGAPQLYRRFKAGTRTINHLNKARDFRPFFDRYVKDQPDVQDLLLQYADNYGELHDYLDPLLRYCARKQEQPTAKLFRFVHKIK
ncbi:AAA family ATPase [Niabella insulamsoli]|uniref:ATP-binding protein n=1 Tax=Niabella insulamsoli TaxID=3144874 RepID=UPI0031FD9463